MNTKILEYLIAIADEGSVSKAADRFYLTQPGLSRHIKNVEEEIGAPLFVRTASGVELTRTGALFINSARTIVYRKNQLEQQIAKLRETEKNPVLRVLVEMNLNSYFIRCALPALKQLNPQLQLDVNTASSQQARRDLLSGNADMAILYSMDTPPAGLSWNLLFEDSYVLLFPPQYSGPATLEGARQAIQDGMTLLLRGVGTSFRTMEEIILVKAGIFPQHVLEESRINNAIGTMLSAGYFTFSPKSLAGLYQDTGIRCSESLQDYGCYLACRPGAHIGDDIRKSVVASYADFRPSAGKQNPMVSYQV